VISQIEQRATQLDEMRKIRILKSTSVDFEKYVKATDVGQHVYPASNYFSEIRESLFNSEKELTFTLPWEKSHQSFKFRLGEVTVYAGGNGGGKSLLTGQVALNLIKQGAKVCIASFEMKPKRTLQRMLRQFTGVNFEVPSLTKPHDIVGSLLRLESFADSKLWLYDQQGTINAKQIIGVARYCAVELGINHFFIDSLMKCVSGEDDYNGQKAFVDELTSLARDHNIHIHLVHHIRKLQSEEIHPNKNDLKGSGAIADQVDNVFMVWRNKIKEHAIQSGKQVDDSKPDAFLMCEKQRNGDSEEWYQLWYRKDSQQFTDAPDSYLMAFDNKGDF
jgi:twinkle protein